VLQLSASEARASSKGDVNIDGTRKIDGRVVTQITRIQPA